MPPVRQIGRVGAARGGRPRTKGQLHTYVKELRKGVRSKFNALEAIGKMSRVELEALATELLIEKMDKQKAHAKAMKKWRKKVEEVINGQ